MNHLSDGTCCIKISLPKFVMLLQAMHKTLCSSRSYMCECNKHTNTDDDDDL